MEEVPLSIDNKTTGKSFPVESGQDEFRPVITSADVDLWEKLDPVKLKSKMIYSSKNKSAKLKSCDCTAVAQTK